MEKAVTLVVAVVAVLLIRLPARLFGERLYAAGIRSQSKWKRDLGATIYAHSFHLTLAIVALFTIVLPKFIFGVSMLDI